MNDELMHYGVLGMKWGIRHDPKYQYESWRTKRYKQFTKRIKNNPQAKSYYNKVSQRSALYDKRELQYAKRIGAGKNIVTRMLTLGVVGGKDYQRNLAIMNGQNDYGVTGKKAVSALLAVSPIASAIFQTYNETTDKRKW